MTGSGRATSSDVPAWCLWMASSIPQPSGSPGRSGRTASPATPAPSAGRLVRSCLEEARLIGVESLPGASIEWSSPFIVRTYPALDRPDARDPTLRRACEAPALIGQAAYAATNRPICGHSEDGATPAVSFSGRVRKSGRCSEGSRARAIGAQQVSASVASTSPLEDRRRDLSPIGPIGAPRTVRGG